MTEKKRENTVQRSNGPIKIALRKRQSLFVRRTNHEREIEGRRHLEEIINVV